MPLEPPDDAAADYQAKSDRERRRSFARRPKPIGNVLSQLITRRGYGRVQADEQLQSAWQQVVGGPLATSSRACRVCRGKLEVLVANSTARQELEFQRERILREMRGRLPEVRLRDLQFRVGQL